MTESLRAIDEAAKKVAKAPRVSLADIEAKIAHRYYATGDEIARDSLVVDALRYFTVCMLVMQNGFVVIGRSAPASPENFNAELGRALAYEDAVRQIWPLEGYLLRERG